MSVIACRVYDDRIDLAADSIRVSGWGSQRTDGKLTKLARVRDVVVGGSGYAAENGLIQLFLQTHRPSAADVQSLLTFLGEFGDWKHKRTGCSKVSNAYLFAFEGRAFATVEYYIEEVHNYYAIGAGEDVATTALHLGHSPRDAVRVACELSVFCEGPIIEESIPAKPRGPIDVTTLDSAVRLKHP